jgi:hypothetical protein
METCIVLLRVRQTRMEPGAVISLPRRRKAGNCQHAIYPVDLI